MSDGGPPRFFHPAEAGLDSPIELEAEEAEHARGSLRLRPGDRIEIVDGRGHVADARVLEADRRRLRAHIDTVTFVPRPDRPPLVVALGLLKGPRFDLALEKLTELGADVLVPLMARHVEVEPKGASKAERWRRLTISAMKQSRRAWLPELLLPMRPAELLETGGFSAIRVAHPEQPPGGERGVIGPAAAPELLAVGPEGGWAPDELALFREHGARFISLGPNRLRSETAALALLVHRLAELGAMGVE